MTPIPGTTRMLHLEENIAALDITLDAKDLDRLDVRTIGGNGWRL
ncbi:hypothetical protein [Rhodococcus sp. I2R]|nr:hypothetical protein [Rhodococcus sp. I2R]